MVSYQDSTLSISFSALYAISSAFGILCNTIILILAWREKVFKDTCQSRLLIAHTSFVDLLVSVFFLQGSVAFLRPNLLATKKYICHGLSICNAVIFSEVHSSFLLLSIQRYFLIKLPLKARLAFTRLKTFVFITFTWCTSIGIMISAEISNHDAKYLSSVGSCVFAPKIVLSFVIITRRVLIFVITIFFYAKAYFAYRNNQTRVRDIQKLPTFSPQPSVAEQSERKIYHGCISEQENCLPYRTRRSKSDPEILFRWLEHSPNNGMSSKEMKRSSSISEGIGSTKRFFSVVSEGNEQRSSIQEYLIKERKKMISPCELRYSGHSQLGVMNSSKRIQRVNTIHQNSIKHVKGKRPLVQPKGQERKREKDRKSRCFSKLRTAGGATKSILIITGYYIVTSFFSFIIPNFKATLPIALEARIIVVRSVHLLYSTNSIINFVVFLIVNKQFRLEVLKLFRCRK